MTNKEYVICTMSKDWADEFDCKAFAIMLKSQWEKICKAVEKRQKISIYFGTNEGWEDVPYKEWRKDIDVKDISEENAKMIMSTFGDTDYSPPFCFGTGADYLYPDIYLEIEED